MSRRPPVDNSTVVSLFPFLAVLLCTMGALLVVLVAVSRAAREAALRASAANQLVAAATADEPDPKLLEEIDRIEQYNLKLRQLRGKAEERLREDQLRLGELESHMRRLQNQLELLHAAALELEAMEEEHYDDREQAEREHERLQRLIAEKRAELEELKEQVQSQRPAYALVPYEGPNGTFRRPIYIECRKGELVLQPEGVRVTREDLHPPFGPGNPLAAALRAARDYYVQIYPEEGRSRGEEPYPLLVVRPEGLDMFGRAKLAIEGADLPFGFELVEEDWDLHYHTANPQLATLEQQAIEQARIRQRALAAAAPRAYRRPGMLAAGEFDFEEGDGEGFDFTGEGMEGEAAYGGNRLDVGGIEGGAGANGPEDYAQQSPGSGGDILGAAGEPPQPLAGGPPENSASQSTDGSTPHADGSSPSGTAAAGAAAAAAGQLATGQGAGGDASADPAAGNNVVISTGQPRPDEASSDSPPNFDGPRGRDWALDRKRPNAVPIRRTIQVVVRDDHLAILDERHRDPSSPAGKRIELRGDTAESLDRFVAAVRCEVDRWGLAGEGMYWRPVLILNVGPDGQGRAGDLARLLHNSGLELQPSTAANKQEGASGATR